MTSDFGSKSVCGSRRGVVRLLPLAILAVAALTAIPGVAEATCSEASHTISNFQVTSKTQTSISYSWSRPACATGAARYRLGVPRPGGHNFLHRTAATSAATITWTRTGLSPGTSYTTLVRLENSVTDRTGWATVTDSTNAPPSASITATSPSSLGEWNLNGATVTVELTSVTFVSGVTQSNFMLNTNVPGLTIDSLATVASGDTTATLTLAYDGSDFSTPSTLGVTVAASAHTGTSSLTTATVQVAPLPEVTVSPPSLALNENAGTTNANTGTFTAVLDSAPAANTALTVASADPGAAMVNPATLTFTTMNWNTAQTVTVTAQADDDPNNEAVRVTLSAADIGTLATVSVTVTDDDRGTVLIDADPTTAALDPGPLLLAEGDTGSYSVRLSARPTATATVAVTSGDTGAVTVDQSSLTFTTQNWNTPQTVVATAVAEASDSVDESVTITHEATGGGYGGTSSSLRVGVSDAERTGTDYDTDEDGLIEISTLAQLNAVRWDLDGNGSVSAGNTANYSGASGAFASASTGMGCPTGGCTGYELTQDLDFDTDGDGSTHTSGTSDSDDTYHNSGSGWDPLGPSSTPSDGTHFNATFDGNGHSIHNLYVNRNRNYGGLFAVLRGSAVVRSLGLPNAYVDISQQGSAAPLAGSSWGRVEASWASGSVAGNTNVGGLVGSTAAGSVIVASYSKAQAQCGAGSAGGLVGGNGGTIVASYATGAITGSCAATNKHGLAGYTGTAASSHWDRETSGVTTSDQGAGRTTAQLQTPTSATGIFAGWADLDVDGDGDPHESPWHFGTSSQYPALNYRGADPIPQRGDYDLDDDGLIDIRTLAQLNAVRWDLNGDGGPSSGGAAGYGKAFRNHVAGMGCPNTGCAGYELENDLDFDTDGDGSTWTEPGGTFTADSGDAYHNGGSGWDPIGPSSTPSNATHFTATFAGNGHVVANLLVNRARNYVGLFAALRPNGTVRSLGLPNARVRRGGTHAAPLAGHVAGRVAAVWATGAVQGEGDVAGLVGAAITGSRIVASYSTAAVECTGSGSYSMGAGLVGASTGTATIVASYSTGAVTGSCQTASKHGLAGGRRGFDGRLRRGPVTASYWDTDRSGINDDSDSNPPEGKTSANLRAPTGYTGLYDAWDDQDVDGDNTAGETPDDDAWDFGNQWQWPVLKFGGHDTARQVALQPNVPPTFGTGTVANKTYRKDFPIASFQVPAASGGEGVGYTYSASGLPAGLSLGAPNCAARTVCGTPTANTTGAATVIIYAHDGDTNQANSDRASLTFTITVVTPTAAITSTNPAALTEANLDNATVTVTLTDTAFASGVTQSHFSLTTNVPGLTVGSLATVTAGDTAATLTLDYTSGDFTAVRTVSVTVAASAHDLPGAVTTGTVQVTPTPGIALSRTMLALEEDPNAGGGTNANVGTYTVALTADPTTAAGGSCAVNITASSGNADVTLDADATPQTTVLSFSGANWNTPQTVTVTAGGDGDGLDDAATVSHSRTGSACTGGFFGTPALPSLSVTVNDDDTAAILLDADPNTPAIDEAGPLTLRELSTATDKSRSYTVRLAVEPTQNVTVTITSDDAAVTVGDTDSMEPGIQNTLMFTSSTWDTAQTVTLTAADDNDGVSESATITHAATTATMSEYTSVAATITANVIDDEAPGFVFDADPTTPTTDDAGPLQLDEDQMSATNSASYTVRLSAQPTQDVTVTITSGDATAVAVGDTDSIMPDDQNTLTFTTMNWDTAQTVTLTAQQDDGGANERVAITHAAATTPASEYTNVSADFEATVDDDETPAITLSASTLSVPERDSATYTVRLATPPEDGGVTVSITGAADGISANPTSLTFTSTNWDTARTVTVRAANDQDGTNETVTLTHTASGGEYDGVDAELEVTATDDDAPSLRVSPAQLTVRENDSATYSIRLNTQPTGSVTVTVSGASGAVTVDTDAAVGNQSTLTFTTTDWDTAQTVTVAAADDDNGADEMLTLSHAASGGGYGSLPSNSRPGVSVTVEDDDEPAILIDANPSTPNMDEAGPLSLNEQSGHADNSKGYTVRLATEPTGPVSVLVESRDRAVHVDTDVTPRTLTLSFTASNWDTAQTVTATAAEDDDASGERVEIAHTASGGEYEGVSAELFATTVDDDEPALVVEASALTASGVAEGGMATYRVRLETEPAGVATVSIAVEGGVSVDADGDQAGLQGSLRFDAANWSSPRTVTVRGLEDDDAASGTAMLRHSASGADYGGVSAAAVSFAVTDDDAPAVLVSLASLAVNEGSTAAYEVRLATAPVGGPVTISLSSSDAAATLSLSELSFTTDNWDAPRRVEVSGAVDDGDSMDGSAMITHAASGGDYGGASAPTVSVSVRDDEAAGVRVEPPQLRIREGGSASYRVRLNTAPSGDATVTATSADAALEVDPGDAAPLERVLTFTTEDWSVGQRVSVSAGRDADAGDASLTVSHAVSGYAGVSSAPALTVLVEDADAPGFVFDPEGGLSLSEEPADPADASGSYGVRLATEPSGTVAVEVSSDDAGVEVDTDGTPRTLSLSFDASNWETAQTVSVRAVADDDQVGESASLLHRASGGGYGGVLGTLRVRVLDDDAPPAPPPPPPVAPENRPPVVVGSLPDLDLDAGESASIRLGGLFADEGPLTHWAETSDAAVASARVVRGAVLELEGLAPGLATVEVWASDSGGLTARLSFQVSVGRVLSFASSSASVPEGGVLRLGLTLSRPAAGALSVSWAAGPDWDPTTADADVADLSALRGTVGFAAGGTEAFIEVAVLDDSDIEPAREYLRVELGAPPVGADWVLGRSSVLLEVEEGVCDRTAAVRDALRGTRECRAPAPSELSRRGYLGLHRSGVESLRPKDLLGLSGLRVLHLHGNLLAGLPEGLLSGLGSLERLRLDGNRLAELPGGLLSGAPALELLDLGGNRLYVLPAGLFAGAAKLSELNLAGNPGAPFSLAVHLIRTDAEPWAPGSARVEARVAEGAPFPLSSPLTAEGAELSAEAAAVPAGALAGPPFQVAPTGPSAVLLSLAADPPMPPDICGDVQDGLYPCFRGLAPQAGPPLLLFKPAPGVTDAPPMPALSANGDRATLPLAELFAPSGEGDRLSYAAESDRPDLLGARIVGEALVLDANEDGAEGTAVVTVRATDADGPSASLSFAVTVEFAPVGALSQWRLGWMRTLREAAP